MRLSASLRPVPLAVAAGAALAAPALAVMHLSRGDTAPALALPDLDGRMVKTADVRGKVLVLVFGELYHGRTLEACRQLRSVLDGAKLRDRPVVSLLVVSQDREPAALRQAADGKPVPAVILHDRTRAASEAYRVAVLPSVVVVAGDGRVVHALAAMTTQFADVLLDALLLATGQIDADAFDARRSPGGAAGADMVTVRAERLTQLARQLARRGLAELAEQKYGEALDVEPAHAAAHLGLGVLEQRRGRLAEAEKHFGAVLEHEADSVDAALGLAFVHIARGGDELRGARGLVTRLLARNPLRPRAHYLLGLVEEKQGNVAQAAASFKQAAELLMEQSDWEPTP